MTVRLTSLAVSLLAAPPEVPVLDTARRIVAAGCSVHVDVMDGSATEGHGIPVALLPALCALGPVEVHLMTREVDTVLADVLAAGPERVMLHVEWTPDLADVAPSVRAAGAQVWAAVGPSGSDSLLPDARAATDGLLLVAITPGSRSEPSAEGAVDRLSRLAPGRPLGVDGGIGPHNAGAFVRAGASHVVSGRAVFAAATLELGITALRESVHSSPAAMR